MRNAKKGTLPYQSFASPICQRSLYGHKVISIPTSDHSVTAMAAVTDLHRVSLSPKNTVSQCLRQWAKPNTLRLFFLRDYSTLFFTLCQ